MDFRSKMGSREELAEIRRNYTVAGKTVGYTSGVFDLLHAGHVDYLARAKALVDVLIVGVNADVSVRLNKGDGRPINPEGERVEVVAALGVVDHVFVFGDKNNNVNVELLKPDVYIKAGDYSTEQLSSKKIVESYGGRVELVSFRDGLSSSGMIGKIETLLKTVEGEQLSHARGPAIFVDRDGTINHHIEYLSEADRFEPIPGALEALVRLRALGYRIIVVTNQPGIGLGYFSKEDFFAVNRCMFTLATKVGLSIDRVYYCPHSKAEDCRCRKPSRYLLERAAKELNIDLARSFVIGDMTSDVQLAKNSGCAGVLVKTGRGGDDGMFEVTPDIIALDLADAAAQIEARAGSILSQTPSELAMEPAGEASAGGISGDAAQNEDLLEALGRFAGSMGHDFNNILGSIRACIDLIRQKTTTEVDGKSKVDDQLRLLERAVGKGIAITDKIRGFIRPGELRTTMVSLKKSVESVTELVAGSRGSEVQFEIVCLKDIEVAAADYTITHMLLQLCENSIDATQHLKDRFIVFTIEPLAVEKSRAALELPAGNYVRLAITDNGRGMNIEQQESVFEPFFSTKSRTVGKGLGLSMAMAKATMTKHNGTITVSSTKGVGTTISLYFPIPAQP